MAEFDLWSLVSPVVPQNADPIVEEAIRAVGDLLSTEGWQPTVRHWLDVVHLLRYGMPLVLAGSAPNLEPLRARIGEALRSGQEPNSSDLAELTAAALLVSRRATSLVNVPTGKGRTPDFHVRWASDPVTEVEVTQAARKPAHIERESLADGLCKQLYKLQQPWDVLIDVADILKPEQVTQLIQTVQGTSVGGHAEDRGHWWLRTRSSNPPSHHLAIDFRTPDHPPIGWPEGSVSGGMVVRVALDERDQTFRFIVRVLFGVPLSGYINPVEHKATRIQGSSNAPLIVALDVGNLPNAVVEFERDLPAYLPSWSSVSAVLLFESGCSQEAYGMMWQLHVNPNAQHPVPESITDASCLGRDRWWSYHQLLRPDPTAQATLQHPLSGVGGGLSARVIVEPYSGGE